MFYTHIKFHIVIGNAKSPLSVAIFTGSSITSFGGAERGALNLANELLNRKIYTVIFTAHDDSRKNIPFPQIQSMSQAKIIRFKKLPLKFIPTFPLLTVENMKVLKEINTIYNIDESLFTGLFLWVYSRIRKMKYVYGMHIPESFLFSNRSAQSKFKKVMWHLYRTPLTAFFKGFVNNIHVINEAQVKSLESIGYRGNIYLIPDFVYGYRESVTFNDENFIVLFTGANNIEIKGIDLLTEIIVKTIQKENHIKFCITGPAGDGSKLINEVVSKYPNNVENRGFVTESELTELRRKASLFIFTSRIDSFSIGIVRAQSWGLPCIAFNITGPKDILKNPIQGSLIDSFNTDKFSDAILNFYLRWKTDREGYISLMHSIQENIYEKLGAETILPKMIEMFS